MSSVKGQRVLEKGFFDKSQRRGPAMLPAEVEPIRGRRRRSGSEHGSTLTSSVVAGVPADGATVWF
jgi:hypothetical protein